MSTPTIESINCECGTIFEWDCDEKIEKWRACLRPTHCDECSKRIAAEEQRERDELIRVEAQEKLKKAKEKTDGRIERITPIRYLQTDLGHPAFNRKLWMKLSSWWPSDETPFLGIVGPSGGCKTRIGYRLLRKIAGGLITPNENGTIHIPTVKALSSSDLALFVGRQFLSSYDNDPRLEARDELDSIRQCEVLLLDDLGKAKNTPSVAAELFAVIDHRHAENLCTIWTANSTPEQIVAGMSEDMAGPLAGRLLECSTIFNA